MLRTDRDEIVWWRCNGKMTTRYDADGRCQSKMVKGTEIEPIVWQDIERWLREPGDLLKELEADQDQGKAAIQEAERTALEARLTALERDKKGYHRQNAQGLLFDTELQDFLRELAESKATIEKRLTELTPREVEPKLIPVDLLQELRHRLDNGLTEEQRQEIARLLVKQITIRTNIDDGKRHCVAEVEYRFNSAVNYRTGRCSLLLLYGYMAELRGFEPLISLFWRTSPRS